MPQYLPTDKRANIRQRIIDDFNALGRVRINDLCRQEQISNTPIYDIMDELGIGHKVKSRKGDFVISAPFKCTGFRQGCTGNCKGIFQFPCPLEDRWF